ncbi:Uncharacterised protein [Flavonifractor plautii]|uniref:Uncharacterized protein n=1 Tax=Flavonifractor plautii TaxID=292800 RepID=A0A174S9J0_FLAPL|nr:Uncharacterised protein [Flavonifractor plautii]
MPSQAVQYATPRPRSACSSGRPSSRGNAPVARITASASKLPSVLSIRLGRPASSTERTSPYTVDTPNRQAWRSIRSPSSKPSIPSSKPG